MTSLKEHILNPRRAAAIIVGQYFTWLPDKLFLKVLFRLKMGYRLDLRNPQTFSEKLQWLKLYNRKPEYTMMVDKASVKDYVASIIGKEYIIPTLGVWERPEDIEWDTLPDKFVLKTTHGGGSSGVLICKNKSTFDRKKAIESLNRAMKMDIYKELKEWPYKNVHKRIIAEQYIEPRPEVKDLPDYKFFCFNGEPKYCQVISGRETNECITFFDHEWNHMPFHEPKDYSFATPLPNKPAHFEQMWQAARQLANGLPFSRIDFYEMEDHSLFGEITLFPTSGMGGFDPQEFDFDFGKMIDIQGVISGGVIVKLLNDDSIEICSTDLPDYKFFCFDGIVKMVQVDYNRFNGHNRNLYTPLWERIDAELGYPSQYGREFKKPNGLEKAIELASILSKDIPHVRVDFYLLRNKIYFGELTFFHGSGYEKTKPCEFNAIMGSWITLPVIHD